MEVQWAAAGRSFGHGGVKIHELGGAGQLQDVEQIKPADRHHVYDTALANGNMICNLYVNWISDARERGTASLLAWSSHCRRHSKRAMRRTSLIDLTLFMNYM